ncbi:aminoglycoside phosphotransferase, partial [Streptomyces tateyamensis]
DPADADQLRALTADQAAAVAAQQPVLPPGVSHGDSLPRDVHVGAGGPVLLDLETVADDLREHDLVVLALAHHRYGVPEREYL